MQFNDGASVTARATLDAAAVLGLDIDRQRRVGGRCFESSGIFAWQVSGAPFFYGFVIGTVVLILFWLRSLTYVSSMTEITRRHSDTES